MYQPQPFELPGSTADALDAAKLPGEAERLAGAIVAAHLRTMVADDGSLAAWECTLAPVYQRWLRAVLPYLEQQHLVQVESSTQRYRFTCAESVDVLWQRWDGEKTAWLGNSNHHAYLTLIEACLGKLPEILTGTVPATDVMFPDSSMHLVEGIYKANLVADYFNHILSDSLKSALTRRTARGERDIRLLEIGAGTGGTTARLLPLLREFGEAITEYCYTDLSSAFLLHAQEHYKPALPALKTAIFDVSKPLSEQTICVNRYDAVIATNVLHATPNMRETLRNAKAVLKRNGLLLINEISEWSWYTHFTFGLLEGWWLYEDGSLRLSGSPALSPAQWKSVLRAERFVDIQFPAQERHGLGQQIIVATSDGVVRQRLTPKATAPKPTAVAAGRVTPPAALRASMAANEVSLRDKSAALFREVVASALKLEAREIEAHKGLEHYGLDSIMVVQLTTRFRKLFPSVRSTLFFEVKSIHGLVEHFITHDRATLMSVVAATEGSSSGPTKSEPMVAEPTERRRLAPRSAASASQGAVFDVAVIGLSGRYPKAPDLDQFWQNLTSGRNCIEEIPAERWRWQDYYDPEKAKPGKSYSKWGGFLTGIDEFDPLFFKIAPKEAKHIDPQERVFLETCYHAIEDSGHTPDMLAPNGTVGVFVGVMNSRYKVQPLYYSIANRVSYLFNFSGPSLAVDSACSSSLTAVHLALESLYGGMCDTAIAGGVNLIVDPQHMLELTAVGMLSESSQCRSFGKDADGFVDAEGVGAVILKPLARAQRDGDNIYAVIKGSALNAGGRTHGYTVPNPVAQAKVVAKALARAKVDAADVSCIEAHGTGTALGDPIEIAGLTKAFNASPRANGRLQYCAIGSLKSNIGHCESAAGIAALTKVLLQLKHRQLVPTLHVASVNEELDFSATPFSLQRELSPWRRLSGGDTSSAREVPRIAGISSFGAGGANAHVVVQEYQAVEPAKRTGPQSPRACIVPLSARTDEQLQRKIQQLHAFLLRQGLHVSLIDLAYTLQVGREAMDERLALIAISIADLQQQLLALSNGNRAVYLGAVKQNKAFIAACKADPEFSKRCDAWMAQGNDAKIAQHWAKGVEVDWTKLYPGEGPRRISLPLYPFARERHWMEPQRAQGNGQAVSATHPLLQRNASTLHQTVFSTSFSGDEFFLVGAQDQRVLPSILGIEMARAAVCSAYPEAVASRDLRFADIVLGDTFVVAAGRELHIALLPDAEHTLFEIYSTWEGQESVHCQGCVHFEPATAPAPADIAAFQERLARGDSTAIKQPVAHDDSAEQLPQAGARYVQRIARSNNELLLEISVADSRASEQWGLPPGVLQSLTQGAAWLLGELGREPSAPAAWHVRELQLHARCEQRCYLVLRHIEAEGERDDESQWAVEAYDALGKRCFTATGQRVQCVPQQVTTSKRKIEFLQAAAAAPAGETITAKPRTISLSAAAEVDPRAGAKRNGRVMIGLSEPGGAPLPATDVLTPRVSLYEHGEGLFSVEIEQAVLDASVQDQIRQALQAVQQRPDAKAVLFTGSDTEFMQGDRALLDRAISMGLYRSVLACPLPTIAVVQGHASGAGFLLGALCDFMVCGRESRYAFADPTAAEAELLGARFGTPWADDLLYISGAQTGLSMSDKGWGCSIVDREQVMPTAMALAKDIVAKSREALRLLKQHFASAWQGPVARLEISHDPASVTEKRHQALSLQALSAHAGIAIEKGSDSIVTLCLRKNEAAPTLLSNLQSALEELAQFSGYRALVIHSEHRDFLPPFEADSDAQASLQETLSKFPAPVIAAFEQGANGFGWLFGLSCDTCIYAERGQYSMSGLWQHPLLLRQAASLLHRRLGERLAKQVLFDAAAVPGTDLGSSAGIVALAANGKVLAQALTLAESSPLTSPALLQQWRRTQETTRREQDERLGRIFKPTSSSSVAARRGSMPFVSRSSAVATEAHANGVFVVRMVDRNAKNMFSTDLIQGLEDVFAHIESSDNYRVVVLCGYDSYFACGGTKESLLKIQQGKARFTDSRIYQLPMSCKLPVIAAMQGHAIGGGWTLGMFADVCLFSAESHYISPYMQYGFTPGAGATLIFPATLGCDLAKETLFTAREYTGSALRAKGMPHRCLPRAEVMPHALALANALASRSCEDLIALKLYFITPRLDVLEDIYSRELAMHQHSFVGRKDALEGIQQHFRVEQESEAVCVDSIAPPSDASAAAAITRDLKALLAAELQMKVDDVDEDTQFVDLGLDSITGVTWVRQINAQYGTKIEATKVYSYPTLTEFSRFVSTLPPVLARLQREDKKALTAAEPASAHLSLRPAPRSGAPRRSRVTSWRNQPARKRWTPHQGAADDAIAVIGVAGQFPRAKNLSEFWQNIAGAKNCIDPVPPQRWNIDAYFNEDISVPGMTNCRWMGALQDCDAFDPLFFSISPTEAQSMDPQQRLMLQCCWHAIENAGINARTLSGNLCGVFIGCGATDYHQRSQEHQYSAQGFTGASLSILAARISYFLNLQGPCMSIDTACSSSLVAIANACDSLVARNCDTALAGGVAVMAGPTMHIKTAQAGMLSPEGRCFAFDHRANGFVPGEAVGVVMLKRLADAERDGDIVHTIIRGWGVNQDGKTNGITAPNPVSQTRLMRSIYDKFGIDPQDIQLMEAHGTGTKLGDPIEVEGLTCAFRHYTQQAHYCALGSVKSNVGHCLYAAGIAGVMKLVLALKHEQLPPAANFERLNEHVDLTDTPFVIHTELKPWTANAKGSRMAAVSSFGFSGTNAHLVLEAGAPSPPKVPSAPVPGTPVMIPLSAKTPEQLRQKALELADFIAQADSSLSLFDIAYTLQVGREAMEERCATVVRSRGELVEPLRAFASGAAARGMYVGSTSSRASKLAFLGQDSDLQAALIEKCIRDSKLEKLMELWVDGLEMPWDAIQPRRSRRVELPLYPFAKECYWLAEDVPSVARTVAGATSAIHPLLHVNTSTLARQRYVTTFRGDEFFLRDHRVRLAEGRIEKVLPGVAYLEMAAAAVTLALPERAASQRLILNNIAWWRPMIVNGPATLIVELGVEEEGTIACQIVSESAGERVLHFQGEADFTDRRSAPHADAAWLASVANGEGWRAAEIYAALTQIGLHYGPAHRGIEKLCRPDGKVVAKVSLPSCVANDSAAYGMHPSVMDAALQACIGFLPSLQALPHAPSVPFTLRSLCIHGPCPSEVFVVLTPVRKSTNGAAVDTCDVAVYARDGRLCVEVQEFTSRVVDAQKAASSDDASVFHEAFYQELLASIASGEIVAEEAVGLG